MSTPRQPLYRRLPEIYRIRDDEQRPPDQLEAYVGLIDEVMAGIRDSIEALYHDLFIETCDEWVIPYLADLVGTSHLSGDPWTLRADVARTVHHRRRKGTLGSIESLTHALSGWAAHAVELRERLLWNQHLNHQRPDAGGRPPLALRASLGDAVRGGLVTLRDPALLSFLDGAFDPFAHVVDTKPIATGASRYNVPNLAIFLWRLEDYLVPVTQPGFGHKESLAPVPAGDAAWSVRFVVHPMAEPMVLFNTHRFRADDDPPDLSHADQVPGPMPAPRLTEDAPTGRPELYVEAAPYAGAVPDAPSADAVGLTLHVPAGPFAGTAWRFRGANLCAWEDGLFPPLRQDEIVIDPVRGRVLFGVASEAGEADPLLADLRLSATCGFSGPTGAHPVSRPPTPTTWKEQPPIVRTVSFQSSADPLGDALADLATLTRPLIVEIEDSMTYALDLDAVSGIGSEAGAPTLRLAHSLWIRAAAGQRPVIVLDEPLRFRPDDVTGPGAAGTVANLEVRLEGLYLTWSRSSATFAASTVGLIEQAALNRLAIDGCTLDPGGAIELDGTPDGTRQPIRTALRLGESYGFANGAEEDAFVALDQIPRIELDRSLCGAVAVDEDYALVLTGSIVDAGSGVGDTPAALAVGAATGDPELRWGPELTVAGMTAFGRMRVASVTGEGGIWIHRLEAHDNQKGCVKASYFSGDGNRLPPHHGCVFGTGAALSFTSEIFGEPGYAQLRRRSDRRILEEGPNRDLMGAFGYLLETHRWKNINIRYREFMPVGVRPVLIPVT